jgi:hypothetical protein
MAPARAPAGAGPGAAASESTVPASAPVVREARYRMSAGIRPLLVFWIRSNNVGGARILWREGDGWRGYELLIGSDPRRAPRKINRWGWEREDLGPDGASLFGLMRKTDEESLDEAKETLSREGQGGYLYKVIRSRVAQGSVHSENTVLRVARDYTYRDLAELQALASAPPGGPPRVRQANIPPGTWPGFLFAVADLIDQAVTAAVQPGAAHGLSDVQATFTFNSALYDIRLRSTEWVKAATYGGRRYERLVRLSFEQVNREKKKGRERFVIVCGTDGPLARVPVFIEYQPKWWFRAQGVLDEREAFP